jgi:transcriptional regulator with GAF, ATPase, and Fis domain
MDEAKRELLWLKRIRDLSHKLAEEPDATKLLTLILDAAIEITGAERGFLVRRRPVRPGGKPKIKIEVARGFDRETLQSPKGSVSRTVVERILKDDGAEGVVTTREEDAPILQVSSVQNRRVLSILSVPMRLRGKSQGVLYLDHRFVKDSFREQDIELMRTFATQAALALETAEQRQRQAEAQEELGKTLEQLEQLKQQRKEPAPSAPAPVPGAKDRALLRFGELVGGSLAMQRVYTQIERMARTWAPVLIQGESGTGKELVARELHERGSHAREPLLSINCAAVHDSLLASELFGYRKGAFTGAEEDRQGLFELAGKGTLFLDEVGDMSQAMQSKLLRALQDGQVRPIGADKPVPVACRVVAATHRDLPDLIRKGEFREDLYYRLDVLRLTLPPLRARATDVPHLFEHFAREFRGRPIHLSQAAHDALVTYPWPGNVRQLQNEVRRLAAMEHDQVDVTHLSPEIQAGRSPVANAPGTRRKTLQEVEREMVMAALEDCNGNKAEAARQLGIPRSTLYHLLDRYKKADGQA